MLDKTWRNRLWEHKIHFMHNSKKILQQYRLLNDELCLKIIDFFVKENHNHRNKIPLLKIIDFIQHITYDFIAENEGTDKGLLFREIYSYCFDHYKSSFEGIKKCNVKQFYSDINNYRIRLPVAGVIIVNELGEFLCVVQKYKGELQLNFPMGKLAYEDNNDPRATGIRELNEETGIKLSDADKRKLKKYKHKLSGDDGLDSKKATLYILEGFKKSIVKEINWTARGEIYGLAWVSPNQVCTNGPSAVDIKLLNPTSTLEPSTLNVSRFVRTIVATVRNENEYENPFETLENFHRLNDYRRDR